MVRQKKLFVYEKNHLDKSYWAITVKNIMKKIGQRIGKSTEKTQEKTQEIRMGKTLMKNIGKHT